VRAVSRSVEFGTVQRESMQVAAELRKALGGLRESPLPAGGTFVLRRVGLVLSVMGVDTVSDRRNSRLP
jgi:hypothetical protein